MDRLALELIDDIIGHVDDDDVSGSDLLACSQVQKLKIWNMPWDILPGKLRQSLCRELELPSITFVRSFKRETKQAEDNKDKVERHSICRLTSLDMRCWDISTFVNWLLEPRFHVDASHLHTLHIHLPDIIEDDSVNGLLCAIGSSLRHLSLFLPHNESWDEVYSVLAGPHFQFLRVLYINIMPGVSPWDIYNETLLQLITFKEQEASINTAGSLVVASGKGQA
ncbi:hypothetical protein JB92DRAFT_3215219 [Gautieria morchelliformis]|nr:hypothetical protein JB92DRAFT_3215219 [Gautieria morchelliformis]